MIHGYIRLWPTGPSRDIQIARVMPHGVEAGRIHFDDQRPSRRRKSTDFNNTPPREAVMRCLREGDRLVVACPAIIGNSYDDIMVVLGWIEERQAVLIDAESGKEVRGITASMVFARAGVKQLAQMRIHPARRALAASEKKPGRRKHVIEAPLKDLLEMWQQPDVYTVADIGKKAGLKSRATYLLFQGIPRRQEASRK